MCRKNKRRVYEADCVEYDNYDQTEYELVDNFADMHVWCNTNGSNKPKWAKNIYIKNADSNIIFKIDTRAEKSILALHTCDKLQNKPPLKKGNTSIYGLGEQSVHPVGKVALACVYNQREYHINCEEVQDRIPNLLCLADCIKMDLVRLVGAVKTRNKLKETSMGMKTENVKWPESVKNCRYKGAKEIIEQFEDVFSGIGKVPGEVSLMVDNSVSPVAHPPRPIPAALREKVKIKLQELERLDILEKIPIGIPTPWCSAMHAVPKKDGQVRITIDPKDLNKALLREYHPTNTVDEVAQRIKGAKYMTVLDANQGYFQLVLDEKSKNYTAFNTPFGRYRYTRLPMGITSAPELFQHVFGNIFSSIDDLENIMDDFLIAENTIEDHNRVLRQTLQMARENNVTFSMKKLQLCT